MNHHIYHLLEHWYPQRDTGRWLLATVIGTQGSAYRKRGATMLFSDQGQQLGLISGGCLEQDLFHQARKCWETNTSRQVVYDMQEEGDIAWRLGIGCGGEVRLLLQPISADNLYLELDKLFRALQRKQTVVYAQSLEAGIACGKIVSGEPASQSWFTHTVQPPVHLGILGGGVDAQPLANMAANLGWLVTVNDPRARYARRSEFPSAHHVDDSKPEFLADCEWFIRCDALIVMHHQVKMDASALQTIARQPPTSLRYLALLGPFHRSEKVLQQAQLEESQLPVALQAPAGLAIGGDLPESIALSMLAQAHATLFQRNARPLKGQPCSIG
ncbi:XdhC family protein [Alteromonas aestuariivivens]|uniref:XdhC family protein n=1 Tax=Alteromonas aestuariivivens TaxID=1938339 RepID=A0A3D8MCC7_9ALTE|nr:XdhC family protein [Alteromonas aestuariivivens]RDV27343.1 XdhC family protein [Alteromonas aestuariivivens]